MGLSSKQVSGDQGIDWGQTLLQSGAAELSKPPSIRRQPPLQQQAEPLKCPRCCSTNTKFCYYNNYNKSQPRHFCKSCKRHWTKGGTLRNVPVGGGRKHKRPKISKATTTTSSATTSTTTTTVATTAAPRQPDFPLSANTGDQKSMSNIFYQALIRSSSSSPLLHETTKGISTNSIPGKPFMGSNGVNTMNSTGLNASTPSNTEFQFTSLSTFDINASLNPASYHSLNAFDHYTTNLDSMEESTITTVNIPSSSSVPWPGPDTSSAMDLPSYWNWSDIDALTSADLNLSWDDEEDAEIKP